jgi:hypothetical protein
MGSIQTKTLGNGLIYTIKNPFNNSIIYTKSNDPDIIQFFSISDGKYSEYKYPDTNYSNFLNSNIVYFSDIKLNPTTSQPDIITLGLNNALSSGEIKYYYPTNNQRTSWANLKFPSGNLYFSGNNSPVRVTAAYNCKFDYDKDTNQMIIHSHGATADISNKYGSFLFKKDLIGSGYTYSNTPYSGDTSAASDFKVNPITKQYSLIVANHTINIYSPASEGGLIYYEMNSSTNNWTKTSIEPTVSQLARINLNFKSNGYPITAYRTTSGQADILKIAEYNGSNWTTTIVHSGQYSSTSSLYHFDFKYNSAENYYGIALLDNVTYSPNKSGIYITNKGGTIKKYSWNHSGNNYGIFGLVFKEYKGETRPFILRHNFPYNDIIYLENEKLVTGEFLNTLDYTMAPETSIA